MSVPIVALYEDPKAGSLLGGATDVCTDKEGGACYAMSERQVT